MGRDRLGVVADGLHGGLQFVGRDAELLGPVSDLVVLAEADAGPVLATGLGLVIGRDGLLGVVTSSSGLGRREGTGDVLSAMQAFTYERFCRDDVVPGPSAGSSEAYQYA